MNKLNLTKTRAALNACHIRDKEALSFYNDCNITYLVTRSREELAKLQQELTHGRTGNINETTERIIQLLTILRVKHAESTSPS